MALPTATGDFTYPYENSPVRSFYQGVQTAATVATLDVLDTITASTPFVLTKLIVAVYDPTAGATVQIKVQNDIIFQAPGTTISSWALDFSPSGLRGSGANTSAVQLIISGATAGAHCYATGYFD